MRLRLLLVPLLALLLVAGSPAPAGSSGHAVFRVTGWLSEEGAECVHNEVVNGGGHGDDWGAEARRRAECWRPLANLAVNRYPVEGGADALVNIVACESAGDRRAVGGVGEIGLAQHHPYFVGERLAAVGFQPDPQVAFQPFPNLLAAAWLAHTEDGWGLWSCKP